MTEVPWRPLSVRESNTEAAYDGPHDGVPEWMFGALWDWVRLRYRLTVPNSAGGYEDPNAVSTYRRIQMALGLSLERGGRGATLAESMQSALHESARGQPSLLLDVADYWLAHDAGHERAPVRQLDDLLRSSRSVWTVTPGNPPFLARRVAREAREAAIRLDDSGKASEHLSRAWRAIYGRQPNPSEGYREAVKAVEVAARPVVSPSNDRTTLGTIIRDMQAKPEKWTVGLKHHTPAGQVSSVVGMMDLLWTGQSDRHGDPDPAAPLDVTQEEAEAALHLALTLVHWYTRGVVALR